jgi:hypothetical protein
MLVSRARHGKCDPLTDYQAARPPFNTAEPEHEIISDTLERMRSSAGYVESEHASSSGRL